MRIKAKDVARGLEYLYEYGHRDILYFRNSNSFYNMYERHEAFKRFMDKYNLQECGTDGF